MSTFPPGQGSRGEQLGQRRSGSLLSLDDLLLEALGGAEAVPGREEDLVKGRSGPRPVRARRARLAITHDRALRAAPELVICLEAEERAAAELDRRRMGKEGLGVRRFLREIAELL